MKDDSGNSHKQSNRKLFGVTLGFSSVLTILYGLDPEMVTKILSETAQSQIAQAGFFFTAAAWIHANKVEKEIAKQVTLMTASMTGAINNVADALRKDLAKHAERLKTVEDALITVNDRLSRVEKP